MICLNETICPRCGGMLKYYDKVRRVLRTKNRVTKHVDIRRFKCVKCRSVHRELFDYIMPYKQYEADVIEGVREGLITSDTLGYENYPCEMTINRWLNSRDKNTSSYGKTI